MRRASRHLAAAAATGFCGAICLAAPAFAAGAGYAPGSGGAPAAGGVASGLAGTVITSTAVQPTGGSGSATIGSEGVAVSVPSGAFTGSAQLVITDASSSQISPATGAPVLTFGVGFYVDGTKYTGSFPPVTVTVTGPGITAGSTVYLVTGSGLQAVSGDQVTNGTATFAITSDPIVEISSPAGANLSAIPGGASAQTGKPVVLEVGLSVLLVLGGIALLVITRLRRRAY